MRNVVENQLLNITVFVLLNTLIGNKIIIKLFCLHNVKEAKLYVLQSILLILETAFMPIELSSILCLITQYLLYKKFFRLEQERMSILIIFNLIISTIANTPYIFEKYQIFLTGLFELVIKLVIFMLVKVKKWQLNNEECQSEKSKLKITFISVLSIVAISLARIKIMKDVSTIPVYLYILFNLFIISYLIVLVRNIFAIIKENDDNIKIENLEGSNKRLQENYDNVRAFKHDFNNIIQGIGGYIIANDIDGLKKMYKSIAKECQEINQKQSINGIIINNPAILNLINNKLKLAEEKDVKMKVEVYVDLNSLKVSTYDLCRVLGILIDNAIEATIGCEEKEVAIKFLRDKFNNRNLIVIENPCKNYLIDVKKIYEKGFSSKKDKISHGLGLWKVKQILKKNKNVQIYTSRDELFKQQLEIY